MFLSETILFKVFYGQIEFSCDKPSENVSRNRRRFFIKRPQTLWIFFQKTFILHLFLWTCGTLFWQPHNNFWTKSQKFSARCSKTVKRKTFQSTILVTMSQWTRRMLISITPSANIRIFFAYCPEWLTKRILKSNISAQIVRIVMYTAVVTSQPKSSERGAEYFSIAFGKSWRNINISKEMFSVKFFLWIHRVQFWECRWVFFWQPAGGLMLNGRKWQGKHTFIKMKKFDQSFAVETKNSVLTTLLKTLRRKAGIFSLIIWNLNKNFFPNITIFPQFILGKRRRLDFWQPHLNLLNGRANIFCSMFEYYWKNWRISKHRIFFFQNSLMDT